MKNPTVKLVWILVVFCSVFLPVGSIGGTRRELQEVIDMAANKEIRVKVWKKLKLDNVKEAIEALSAKETAEFFWR